ncbi:hypothetical protein LZZ85_19595 [Terrimonas sp. NA20]|uniref:6-bladed beta-propeller n=1 Tax=Terrimonas ginsenosidimutans TaxID=2908004 RepID=A0ABS9KVW4_9BACT|nr:hypothetical protein [Terrimonas ginsenosidimutans]MCG2616514.1 hypothetical protein [Terrimonas ginsenosidimutans]
MKGGRWILCLITLLAGLSAKSQRIVYSQPDREDSRRLNFEVIGKMNGNFLIYKSIRNKNWISILDNDMKEVAKVDQDYLPDNDRVINVDFFPYGDFAYMIYQYRKKSIVYCAAAKIDPEGKKIGELISLDTTQIGSGDNKIYSVISSEDKSKIMIFKINKKDRRNFMTTTILLDEKLQLIKKSRLAIPMQDRDDDYLSEFQLDNEGDLIFSKFNRVNNENIGEAAFLVKYAQSDTLLVRTLKLDKIFLDEIRIKPDNVNKRFFLTSFYVKQKRGNTDGYYFYIWDKATQQPVIEDTFAFSDALRREARGNSSIKAAFNEYFIRQIVVRRDGGFIIASEAFYTSSRGSSMWNRYNYMYSPYFRSYDYYYYSPYYNNSFWGNRFNDFQNTRYQADNITIQSFDKNGKREWSSVITKEQFDDQSDDLISYQIMNTGGQVHFLFNNLERRVQLLTDFSVKPDGTLTRNPTLKDLDRGYEFMPKYGKQVSARQMIIPCVYRNYICFAKLEY